MNWLLDANVVIALMKVDPPAVRNPLRRAIASGGIIATSSIVLQEIWYGIMKSSRPADNKRSLEAFLAGGVEVLPFDQEDAARAGEVRAVLKAKGSPIGPYDVLIAAQALQADMTVATGNVREFRRIDGLKFENWLE